MEAQGIKTEPQGQAVALGVAEADGSIAVPARQQAHSQGEAFRPQASLLLQSA